MTTRLLTIAVCTRNRATYLAGCLASLAALDVPSSASLEVVIADNASTDGTAAVIGRFATTLPIRHLGVEALGASHARNAVIESARGDYILWTDDDAVVNPGWVTAYVEAFERWPEAALFGGPIVPRFEPPTPQWLARHWPLIDNVFAARPSGVPGKELSDRFVPYGPNFVVSRAAAAARRFDVSLGPQPGSALRGEETRFVRELLAAGYTGRWVPGASVVHVIPSSRQSVRYIRQYFQGHGQLLATSAAPTGPALFGRPRWALRRALSSEAQYRLARLSGNAERWLPALAAAGEAQGYWYASRVEGPGR